MKTYTLLVLFFACALAPLQGVSQDGLKVGDTVPQFVANDDDGQIWSLADHLGKEYVVVYFYPAAMTGGCTMQACAYRDQSAELNSINATVVGVSGDSVRALELFKKAHGLNFTLLSDVHGVVARNFGVPIRDGGSIQREIEGEQHTLNRALTTARWTFVVGKDGRIVYRNESVDVQADTAQVIEAIKSVSAS